MVEILTSLERFRLSTERGREDIEGLTNPADFYYTVRKKGEDCIEALTFLADYLPEKYQEKLFDSKILYPLFDSILSVGIIRPVEGEKRLEVRGMPLEHAESRVPILLKLDKEGQKMWDNRKKRIRKIINELLILMDKAKPEELASEAYQILERLDSTIGVSRGLQAIRLQEDIIKLLQKK